MKYDIVTCLCTSDTNWSRVRISVTNDNAVAAYDETSDTKCDVYGPVFLYVTSNISRVPDSLTFKCEHLEFMIRVYSTTYTILWALHNSDINHFSHEA
jgi:hypothetical protein